MVLLSSLITGSASILASSGCYYSIFHVSSKGAADSARAMFMFDHLLRYWIRFGLPIVGLFKWNHTIFSEESGEIALSVLSHSQPLTKHLS